MDPFLVVQFHPRETYLFSAIYRGYRAGPTHVKLYVCNDDDRQSRGKPKVAWFHGILWYFSPLDPKTHGKNAGFKHPKI